MQIVLGPQVCGDLAAGVTREWLVPDGLGGYAMGTVCGLRTRRYHGLLVAATRLPGRMVGLLELDPVVVAGGARVRLGTHEWGPDNVNPAGHVHLESFVLADGLPRWRWRVGDVVIERELAMREGAVAVRHRLVHGGPVRLELAPLCTWRDAHGERRESDGLRFEPCAEGFTIENAYRVRGPGFEPSGTWCHGAYYREEAARGLTPTEDLYRAGRFVADLRPGQAVEVLAWTGDLAAVPAPGLIERVRERNRRLAARAADPVAGLLNIAADAFVVRRPEGIDVIAGYPWFGAWSRDTLISYEGLFLATGRADEGRELLRGYARTLSEGMLANTADTGRVEYNTADATLWLLHAVERHTSATGDRDLAAELAGPLSGIVQWHVDGTRYGIRVDTDGLLTQGADGYALTWMDAVVDGRPITPRPGKAVELNALWLNGLAALRQLTGDERWDALHLKGLAAFEKRFTAPQGWLYDRVDGPDGDDASLRPNQLFAYSLPYGPLRAGDPGPVRAVGRELLTPLGLRTLAPADPAYRGRHRGAQLARDEAYHQGTVWPWLIGSYVDACRAVGAAGAAEPQAPGSANRAEPQAPGAVSGAEPQAPGAVSGAEPQAPGAVSGAGSGDGSAWEGLVTHLGEWGLGSVSETADGDAPHAATGCPFQAWSVAELRRTYR